MGMCYELLALTAAISFAASGLINKFASKHSINRPDSLMAYFMASQFLFAFFLIPSVWPITIIPWELIGFLLINVVAFLIGYYLFYKAIFTVDPSTFAPLFQLQAIFIGILAYAFLGERFEPISYLWMGLIILGSVLVAVDEKMKIKSFLTLGVGLIMLMQLFHAISNYYAGVLIQSLSPNVLLFWIYLTVGLLFTLFILIKRPKTNYPFKKVRSIMAAGLISAFGALAMLKAFETNLTITSVIALLSGPFVFIASVLISRINPRLLEYHTAKVYLIRGFGLVLTITGALKITLG